MLITFVIPAYNLEKHIENTLRSIIAQTVEDYEIILVDDGSVDNTGVIAQHFLQNLEHVQYKILRKANGGVSSARNLGMKEACGEYIVFLDGDDLVESRLVEEICKTIEKLEAYPNIIIWGYDILSENNKITMQEFNEDFDVSEITTGMEILKNIQFKKLNIRIGSAAYKRKKISEYGLEFTEGCINGEDQEFIYKFLIISESAFVIENNLHHYILSRNNSVSNSFNVKKFHAVKVFGRVCSFAGRFINEEYAYLFNIIMVDRVVETFFYNFIGAFKSMNHKAWYKYKISCETVRLINGECNGIIDEIRGLLSKYESNGNKLSKLMRLYLLSPNLCGYFITLRAHVFRG